jgi:hypothetical protein
MWMKIFLLVILITTVLNNVCQDNLWSYWKFEGNLNNEKVDGGSLTTTSNFGFTTGRFSGSAALT